MTEKTQFVSESEVEAALASAVFAAYCEQCVAECLISYGADWTPPAEHQVVGAVKCVDCAENDVDTIITRSGGAR